MRSLIVANWKCNPTNLAGAKRLFNSVKRGIKKTKNVNVVICPPFIYIPTFQHSNIPTIKLGAQDCFWEQSGAFTGEVSPAMLKDLGCQYVILGHSERRKLGETDEMINKKIKAALKENLRPILCIGETEEERKAGKTFEVLRNQLKKDLEGIVPPTKFLVGGKIENLILAYEPVWAIGTGNPCRPEDAKRVLLFLRKILKTTTRPPPSHKRAPTPILYGGSVNSENALGYIKEAGFEGLLVGGASLDSKEFIKIVENVERG